MVAATTFTGKYAMGVFFTSLFKAADKGAKVCPTMAFTLFSSTNSLNRRMAISGFD